MARASRAFGKKIVGEPGLTHVAGVRTARQILLFIDGKLVGNMEGDFPPIPVAQLWIGDRGTFEGTVDEVRVSRIARYDRDFTPQSRCEPDRDTLALYHCDEGEGNKLTDASGNGRHGMIVDPKWVRAEGMLVASTDPDRRVAEWVLSAGGSITIRVDNIDSHLKSGSELPKKPFRLRWVSLQSNRKVNDDTLAELRDCKELSNLDLGGTQITNKGLVHLKDCKTLDTLNLSSTRVTDLGLQTFKDWDQLSALMLANTPVTDAGLENFKNCKNLTSLHVSGTQITDKGLVHFKDCKKLNHLNLSSTAVTDVGLAYFKDCKDLSQLNLGDTRVTDAGLAKFTAGKYLMTLILEKTAMDDTGIAALSGYANLRFLNLKKTSVTADGVKKLAAALPQCRIQWDGGEIKPKVAADPDRRSTECGLSTGSGLESAWPARIESSARALHYPRNRSICWRPTST